MTILPQTKFYLQQEVIYNSRRTKKINRLNMVSSRHPYIYNTVPYTGTPAEVTESHTKDTLTLLKQIAERQEQHGYLLNGPNISMNRCYTSISLVQQLYDKNITCIGKLNSNRKGLPKKAKKPRVEKRSCISCKNEEDEVTWNSYVVKTKSVV